MSQVINTPVNPFTYFFGITCQNGETSPAGDRDEIRIPKCKAEEVGAKIEINKVHAKSTRYPQGFTEAREANVGETEDQVFQIMGSVHADGDEDRMIPRSSDVFFALPEEEKEEVEIKKMDTIHSVVEDLDFVNESMATIKKDLEIVVEQGPVEKAPLPSPIAPFPFLNEEIVEMRPVASEKSEASFDFEN